MKFFLYISLVVSIALCIAASFAGHYEILPFFVLNTIGSYELIKDYNKETQNNCQTLQ